MDLVRGTVLLIEDDVLLGESLRDYLEMYGFAVTWIKESFSEVEQNIDFSCFDVVVLDLILPERSGEEILSIVRSRFSSIPVLVLTAKGDIEAKRDCFLRGADDYLVKPFDMEELVLRLDALLRRSGVMPYYVIEDCLVNRFSGVIIKNGREVKISRKSWDLLMYLLENRGRIVDKDEILKNVWADAVVTEETLRAYIKELRKLFPKAIETYKGRGYRLV